MGTRRRLGSQVDEVFVFKDKSKSSAKKVGQATQAIAAVLKEFGEKGFSVEGRTEDELREQCNGWIQHLLTGAPSPNRSDLSKDWLDWPGVRDFVAGERTRERSYVVENLNDLRQLAWAVVSNFTETLESEVEDDGVIHDRLEGLKDSADVKSGDELKVEVMAAVQFLNHFLENRRERINEQINELSSQVESLRSELTEVKKVAETDGLTQLFNRASLDDHIDHTIRTANRSDADYILLLCDIDHFKKLNDTYGHPFGDEVLKEVAASLGEVFGRDSDFTARYGGEEFAIVAGCKLDHAQAMGERLLSKIRSLRFKKDGETVKVAISIGIAGLKKAQNPSQWIERADKALYASKRMGRDQLTIDGG